MNYGISLVLLISIGIQASENFSIEPIKKSKYEFIKIINNTNRRIHCFIKGKGYPFIDFYVEKNDESDPFPKPKDPKYKVECK